jgi:hypothetical protein
LKFTHPSNPDYANIQSAISAIEKKAIHVNQNITKSEAKNEVIAIQEKLTGDNVPVLLFSNFLPSFIM